MPKMLFIPLIYPERMNELKKIANCEFFDFSRWSMIKKCKNNLRVCQESGVKYTVVIKRMNVHSIFFYLYILYF